MSDGTVGWDGQLRLRDRHGTSHAVPICLMVQWDGMDSWDGGIDT